MAMTGNEAQTWLDAASRLAGRWSLNPPDPVAVAAGIAAVAVWIGFASAGAARAERCRRRPFPHWLLGLLLPVAYPLWILLSWKPAPAAAVSAPAPEPATAPSPAATAAAPAAEEGDEAAAAPDVVYDRDFFVDLLRRGGLSAATPCRVTLRGNVLLVTAILDTLPEVAVVVIQTADGGSQRMRIPYAAIEAVDVDAPA